MKEEKKDTKKKKKRFRWLRRIARVMLGILIFLLLLVFFIRSEWGQEILVNKATQYVSNKTNTKVEIEKLFVTFDGDILLKGLYLEDKKGDTLVYSRYLEADIPLWPIINGNGIGVESLDWEGVKANITRTDSIEGYNFQFLLDAFASSNTTSAATDTTSTPLNIILGDLNLKEFDVIYNDAVLGIESHFVVGELELDMKKTDLENFRFEAATGVLRDATVTYTQRPVPIDPNAEPAPLPYLGIEELTVTNSMVSYRAPGDGITAELGIVDLFAEVYKADLASNDIDIGDFILKNSIVRIKTETEENKITETAKEVVEGAKQDIAAFEWPEFLIAIDNLDLSNNDISYQVQNTQPVVDQFNADAIFLKDLDLKATDVFLKDKKAGFTIENGSFKEASGFNLKELAVNFNATDTEMSIEDLVVHLNENKVRGQASLSYPELSALVEAPEKSMISVNIPEFQIDLQEVFTFQPDLRNNEYLRTLNSKYVSGNIDANGYLSDINISKANAFWGNTWISATGSLKNVTNPEKLQFNFPRFLAETKKKDLRLFVNEQELGVNLPKDIKLTGTISGSPTNIMTDARLTTTQGVATVKGTFKNDPNIVFDGNVTIEEYHLEQLLSNEQLGPVSLTLTAKGTGSTINTLDATMDATISSLQLKAYTIEDLHINGTFENGQGTILSEYKDKNINLDLAADVVLDSVATQANVSLHLIGADLQALGLMQRDVRTGFKLDADFTGNLESYDVISTIGDGVVVYDDKTYLVGGVTATAHVRKDTTSIWLDNKLLHLELESNTDPVTFSKALQRHVFSYFYRDTDVPDSIVNPVKLSIKGKVRQAPILNEVFLVNMQDLDTVTIAADFDEKARRLKANVTAPHINYAGNEIDSLAFSMDTDKDTFEFDLGFKEIAAGPLKIQRTKIEGNQTNNELDLDFLAYQDDEKLIQIKTQITGTRERLVFHVVPDSLIIQKNSWQTPADNELILTENKINFNNFRFSRGNQSVAFSDNLPIEKDHVGIDFENFELSEFLNYLNPETEFASGNMNGRLVIEDVFGNTGILADLDIREFNVLEVPLGTMSVDAKSLGGNSYDFNAAVKGGDVDMEVRGDYVSVNNEANLDLDVMINRFNMKALEGFTLGEIKDADGSFKGSFKVSGTPTAPKYNGNLTFTNADLTIVKLNAPFTLENETLNIDNSGLSMNGFTIRDANGNTFVVSGSIGTENFVNPTFDLQLKADDFQVLSATKDDNDFLYGTASFDADATITGDLQIPIVNMTASVNSNTDVTYIMPTATANFESRDGVVIFVNRENPDAILTRTEEETGTITGFDVSAIVNVGKDAKVKIIIDEQTGDNFQVFGEGDFNFNMKPNGRMTLSGVYDVAGGHYEMNLYNLVNRKFSLAPGSRVSWSGDPLDAKLDVRAIYDVEASASPLMASVTSGSDPAIKTRFRQVLPFYVYLNVDGELLQPKISFRLDMPEEEQGAIGGQVYGRVQQLNSQEAELNKQVFSLLVLNRFYPEPGSDGSRGGAASIARDNINDALSDQLNIFSDKLLGDTGVELDFGLDSYTDYQGDSPQERTQLDIAAQKKLFNDRLIVRVGSEVDIQGSSNSGENTALIGNVSLEYILTENGRYRLKGFRRNEFENVIDGQTVVSGIALIFTQEFNKFEELWQAILSKRTEEEKEAANAAKKAEKQAEEENEGDGTNTDNKNE